MLVLCLYEFQRTFSPSCADYNLKDYKPYRIFIYADMEYKQQRIMNNYKDPKNTAYENILKCICLLQQAILPYHILQF